jgi:hypothetical protein
VADVISRHGTFTGDLAYLRHLSGHPKKRTRFILHGDADSNFNVRIT